jgi:acetyl-CoA synthase
MSRIIASAAIRGAHKIVNRAENALNEAKETYGPEKIVEFPNTGYFLPVIYAMTGIAVRTIGDMFPVLKKAKELLPPVPAEKLWLPYLGHALDAGMATLFADEIIEVLKYLEDPPPYHIAENCPMEGDDFWLGAADDLVFRKRGLEFVDGTAPGFAAIVGCAPDNKTAVKIARELQSKNLYVFMTATSDGKNMAEQLRQEGVQLGWETRLVPFGKDITATVFPLGFASRVAMSFGGVQPGDFTRNLLYNKMRTYAFVLALGDVDDEKYAQAAGAINYGFPTIADTDIPEILPSGVCTYEHVVAMPKQALAENIYEEIVSKAIEVRGLKIEVHDVPIPVACGAAFEGERIRKEDMYVEFGGQRTPSFEYLHAIKNSADVTDGKIELFGPEIDDVEEGGQLPLGIVIEVYGRTMQADFESVLERMLHTYINEASGVWHNGQRDIDWLRISKTAKEQGFKIKHLGDIIHARLHQKYGTIVDKVQVKLYTNEDDVLRIREEARKSYHERDVRIAGMTDESVDTFYSCTLCQSFAPKHVCVITPERSGLCGGYTWLDAKANFQIIPTGPNQPIQKNDALDENYGQWQGVNEYLYNASRSALSSFSAYSMIIDPMTSCGCFECISAILPLTNGIMIVNREFQGMTPSGMKFSTLAGSVGGGLQTPGFIGHSRTYITSRKFIIGDGGYKRITWMTTKLKNDIGAILEASAKEEGIENFLDMIADETIGTTEEEILGYLTKMGHPALEMDPMI